MPSHNFTVSFTNFEISHVSSLSLIIFSSDSCKEIFCVSPFTSPFLPLYRPRLGLKRKFRNCILATIFAFRRKSFAIIYEDYSNLSTISLSFKQKRQNIHPIFKSRTRENNYRTLNIGSFQLTFLRDNFFSQYAQFWQKRNFATLRRICRIQLKFRIFAKMTKLFPFQAYPPPPQPMRPSVSQVLSSLFRVMPVSWENMGD